MSEQGSFFDGLDRTEITCDLCPHPPHSGKRCAKWYLDDRKRAGYCECRGPVSEQRAEPQPSAPQARRSDPQTSHDAAHRTAAIQKELHRKIYACLRSEGAATASDIADGIYGVGENRDSISPRMKEMEALDLVERTGEKRVPRDPKKHAKQTVWRALA